MADAASILADYEAARDSVLAQISEGSSTVSYKIGGREHVKSDPIKTLEFLEKMIDYYSRKVAAGSRGTFRVVKIQSARGSC